MTAYLFSMLAGGLLGSVHCIGMCGGFAASIGALRPRLREAATLQAVYSAGRITTYAFLGTMAGALGARATGLNLPFLPAQRAIALAAGVVMIGFGLAAVGLIRFRRISAGAGTLFAPLFRRMIVVTQPRHVFLAGVFTGFLPCGLVYAFLALALGTGNAWAGLCGMALFGLGTTPAMAAIGCGAALLPGATRLNAYRLAGAFTVVLGVVTIWRGLPLGAQPCHSTAANGSDAPCHVAAP